MNKVSYFFLFLWFITLNSDGQPHQPSFSANVLIGTCNPVGKFGNKSVSKDTVLNIPGKANIGAGLQIGLNYKVTNVVGATLLVGGEENKQNVKSMNNYFKQYAVSDSTIYNTNTRNWKIGKILAGIFLKIPMSNSNKFYFEPTLLAGALKTSAPGYQVSSYQSINGSREPLGLQKISDYPLPWTFCYQIASDFNWQYNSKIFFQLSANYSHASSERKFIVYTILLPTPSNPKEYETNFVIESINVLAGVGFKF